MKITATAKSPPPAECWWIWDIYHCLDHYPGGLEALALNWKQRSGEKDVVKAIEILRQKFAGVDAYGPGQVVEFHNAGSQEEQDRQARRAFELVQAFLTQAG